MKHRSPSPVRQHVQSWIANGADEYDRIDRDEVSRLVRLVRSVIGVEPRSALEGEAGVVVDFASYRKPDEA